jgi:hypothetical protein
VVAADLAVGRQLTAVEGRIGGPTEIGNTRRRTPCQRACLSGLQTIHNVRKLVRESHLEHFSGG